MQLSPLTGKVTIVTGASQGIGAGGTAVAVQGDVSRAADVQRLFAETTQTFGALDVLVNNAGVFAFAPIEAVTAHEFHREFTVNVLGANDAGGAAALRATGRERDQ